MPPPRKHVRQRLGLDKAAEKEAEAKAQALAKSTPMGASAKNDEDGQAFRTASCGSSTFGFAQGVFHKHKHERLIHIGSPPHRSHTSPSGRGQGQQACSSRCSDGLRKRVRFATHLCGQHPSVGRCESYTNPETDVVSTSTRNARLLVETIPRPRMDIHR